MEFTYEDYRALLHLLRQNGYVFTDYHSWQESPRCVILRHDVDQSLSDALALARLEAQECVRSTYFVLLRTDFYNAASAASREMLREMQGLGHEIGLHFDEVAYGRPLSPKETVRCISRECGILAELLEAPVTTVSMHRPSKATLEADLRIPGIVNSYGETFFRDFKYLSDSRCHWREPVLDIIRSGEYDRLHILTHAFWYHNDPQSIGESIANFVRSAPHERYVRMGENIRDLTSVLLEEDI